MNLQVPIRSVSLARGNTHIFVCLQDGKLIVIGVESSWRQPRHRMSGDACERTWRSMANSSSLVENIRDASSSSNITWHAWMSAKMGISSFKESPWHPWLPRRQYFKQSIRYQFSQVASWHVNLWELARVSYWITLTRLELAWNWTRWRLSVVNYIFFNVNYS